MRAGERGQYITIKEKTVSGQDSRGADEYTWTDVVSVWASIRPMSGREMEAAHQIWAEARFRFFIEPYVDGIQRDMVITWGTRTLNILDVEDPSGMRKELHGYAKELVA